MLYSASKFGKHVRSPPAVAGACAAGAMGRRDLVPAGRRPVAQCQRVSSQSVPHARAPAWSCERRRHAAGPEQEREPEASEGAAGCDFACVASRTSSLMGKTCHTVLSRMERSWWVAVRVAVAVADARFLPRSSPHCPGHAKRAMWNAFPGSESVAERTSLQRWRNSAPIEPISSL